MLHNRGSAFSLDPRSPNIVAPRKRPFHSIIAGFVMKDGRPLMTFGNMGGSVQPETHAQHIVNLIDLGMNVQMTTDAARFTHSQTSNVLSLEANLFNRVGAALRAKGHEVRSVSGGSVGGYQGILFTRDPRLPEPRSIAAQRMTRRSTASIAPDLTIARMARPSAGDIFRRLRHEIQGAHSGGGDVRGFRRSSRHKGAGGAPLPPATDTVAPDIPGVVAGGTKVQLLKEGLDGTEGPIAMPDGSVIFSEINANRLIKIDNAGTFSTFLENTGGTTGLQFDRQGRLYAAVVPWGSTKFSIIYPEAAKKVVIDNYDGKAFGRPNDLDDR